MQRRWRCWKARRECSRRRILSGSLENMSEDHRTRVLWESDLTLNVLHFWYATLSPYDSVWIHPVSGLLVAIKLKPSSFSQNGLSLPASILLYWPELSLCRGYWYNFFSLTPLLLLRCYYSSLARGGQNKDYRFLYTSKLSFKLYDVQRMQYTQHSLRVATYPTPRAWCIG
jgi:hypothetical protein